MTIPEISQKIKALAAGERTGEVLLGIGVLLFGTLAFGLGKWSSFADTRTNGGPVIIANTLEKYKTAPFAYYDGVRPNTKGATGISASAATAAAIASQLSVDGAYVASKNGTKYYPKGCAGANRIKPENAIWFKTGQEAERAGYALSVTCK